MARTESRPRSVGQGDDVRTMPPRAPKDPRKQWRKDAESLSYEESLQAADLLLTELQGDNIPLAQLQETYQRGQIYLEHCDHLLESTAQQILQLDPATMTTQPLNPEGKDG